MAVVHDTFHRFCLHVIPDHKVGALMNEKVPVTPREKKFIRIIKMTDKMKMTL
jgi:hypothetical protein